MQEIFITTIEVIGIYLLGMVIPYIVFAKIIRYDNMISDEQETADCIITFSWIGVAFTLIIAIIYGLKLLLDRIFKIKKT